MLPPVTAKDGSWKPLVLMANAICAASTTRRLPPSTKMSGVPVTSNARLVPA
jgi:hypothetical protein